MKQYILAASASIFSMLVGPNVKAQNENLGEREIRSSWTISSVDLLVDNDVANENSKTMPVVRNVKSGEFVMKQRLLPNKAAILVEALLNHKGDVIAPAGAELFGLLAGSGDVYCLAKTPDINVVGAFFIGSVAKVQCFKDVDRDGRFDGRFRKKSQFFALPQLSGKHSKKLKPVSGGSYVPLEPEGMERKYFVGIKYEGKPLLYSRKNFRILFGDKQSLNSLSNWFYTEGKDYPQTKNPLGGSFTVLSEEDGDLNIRVDKPLKEQPFAVTITVKIR